MDTRESKTPQEEYEHLREVRMPEDYEHPEPDAEQPEAQRPAKGWHWLLLAVAVVTGLFLAYRLMSVAWL
ncbi:hypothetical protein HOP51_12845 [Halomonas sp. MCCC 1A11036]|jgi:hypothetical protein|uniref:Uncharacterized protein n=2 Tax=Billgrantia TaxID=3137761 RepID=A0A6I6SNJ2_9GAMM|nr:MULTISPECIES: hypothetical protein [Halomonas]MCE8020989.1 hypothetical protein [Halomonas zhangzhouensis]MCE8033799.1 hypothetical protein [Halomonas sp. MCCC 1A11057]MDX5434184.1 hypothetical protein [Halomonas sp.]QHC51362.1 hypothetical protein EKK97_19635 [Halomonas tianxiuensis]